MDLTPPVNLLKMWIQQKPNYTMLFCEAVDNAFDANANRIKISRRPNRIQFEDDGIGISRKRLPALFVPGQHEAMTSTRLGQFGVGITTQAVAAAHVLEVDTVSADGGLTASVTWDDLMKQGRWRADDPLPMPIAVGEHTGTTITLSRLRPTKIPVDEKLIEELAGRFHPALMEGRQIFLDRIRIAAIPDPRLRHAIEQEFIFEDGRHASLRGGMLIEASKRNRVHVSYAHRVIMPASPFGCGDYGGIMKMFARLQLSGPWKLTPYKDDLADEVQRDELEIQVYNALKPILEQCQTASFDAKIEGIKDLIVGMLPPHLAPARPEKMSKKKPAEKRQRKKAAEIDPAKTEDEKPGPARTPRSRSGPLKIDIEGKNEEDGIAGFRRGPPPRINLPPDNPIVDALLRGRDNVIAAKGLLAIIMCVYEHHRREGQLQLDHFGRQVADLLALNPEIDLPNSADQKA